MSGIGEKKTVKIFAYSKKACTFVAEITKLDEKSDIK
jgi:hypothetical protein